MKRLKNRGILCVISMLLLTAALAAIYSRIGLGSDIRYAKKQCAEKVESLTYAVVEVVGDANRVAVRQEEACRRYVELRAYPFRAQAQRLGDAVIGLYADGCIVRLSGDALIAPEGVDLSSLDASAFRDDDGARDAVSREEAAAVLEKFDSVKIHANLLQSWTAGAQAKKALVDYMCDITNKSNDAFIPVSDRIAVFDLDGTLMCETYPRCFEYMVFVDYALDNPNYTPTDEVKAVAQEILDTRWQEKPSGISTCQAAAAVAYRGLTPAELEDYVAGFMDSDAEGFTGLKRGAAFYLPMVELVRFLEANDFTIYIVTATERNIVRALVKDTLGIPPARVIGTEYGYTATGQGDTPDGDYTFQSADKVVFDGNYYGENAKMSKVDAIVREIGQQPVLAFGNSSGDVAMCEYTVTNNPYGALSYIVLADDEVREWGDTEEACAKTKGYHKLGIGTISMRDDFVTIYGDGVEKDAEAAQR